jgi:heat-inducible transcriptional repressor
MRGHVLTPRQELILGKVIDAYAASGQAVGSKALAADPDVQFGPSTIRNELALLEEHGLLAHPHTSAGRVPTDAGHRYYVDRLLPAVQTAGVELQLIRREVDEAMRVTTETLSQVTNLLAIVTAPPLDTATIRHIEVLLLQPQVVMVVVITSTGGVSKRVLTFDRSVDQGLVAWAGEELNGRLVGLGLGARMLRNRLDDPLLGQLERDFLRALAPAFIDLASAAEDSVYVDGTAHLLGRDRIADLVQIEELMAMLERRVTLLELLRAALGERDVLVRIGTENDVSALQSLSIVTAGYGLPTRKLGTVSVIGPVRMDYANVISSVRTTAHQLSRFIEDVYQS